MDIRETQHCISTRFPSGAKVQERSRDALRSVRHASVVINRALRSSGECDQILQERLFRAVSILEKTDSTETALLQSRPGDVIFRLAARVARALCSTSLSAFPDQA